MGIRKSLLAGLVLLVCGGCENKQQSNPVFKSPEGNYSLQIEIKEGAGEWKYLLKPSDYVGENGQIGVPEKGMDTFVRQHQGGRTDLMIISWAGANDFKVDVGEMENLFMVKNGWNRTSGPDSITIDGKSAVRESFFVDFRNTPMYHTAGIVHAGGRSYTFLASSNRSSQDSETVFGYFTGNIDFEEE
jgi:hypothetical protein